MRAMRMGAVGVVAITVLVASGGAWTQEARTSNIKGIDIIVKKKPGGSNMVCMAQGKPCDQKQVELLSAEAAKRGFMVSLNGSDGSLSCSTKDRKECPEEAVGVVKDAGSRAVGTKGINGN